LLVENAMNTSRFSGNGFGGNGTGHEDAGALRVCQGLEEAPGGAPSSRGPDGRQERGEKGAGKGRGRACDEKGGNPSSETRRDEAGRFAKGCKAGPGNPYNRQVAMLKRELLEAVTPEDVREIGKRLVAEAKDGSVAAARVLFMYVLPKN